MWIVRLALRRSYTFVVLALLIAVLGTASIVIDAERTLLANQVTLAQAVNLQMAASVRLITALGGGWDSAEDRAP
jgi:outer membrane protein TolC